MVLGGIQTETRQCVCSRVALWLFGSKVKKSRAHQSGQDTFFSFAGKASVNAVPKQSYQLIDGSGTELKMLLCIQGKTCKEA
jgi:hypothetical protein